VGREVISKEQRETILLSAYLISDRGDNSLMIASCSLTFSINTIRKGKRKMLAK
jgi:hypothetical protein